MPLAHLTHAEVPLLVAALVVGAAIGAAFALRAWLRRRAPRG
jgi:hypothetical protein